MGEKFKEDEQNIQNYIEKLLSVMAFVRDYSIEEGKLSESDRKIIGSAIKYNSDYLVTGDKLLQKTDLSGIKVIDASQLLKFI